MSPLPIRPEIVMPPAGRRALLGGLTLAFFAQTWLVYTDQGTTVTLTGDALAGSELWHDHGCQTCHQLYGYGGFVGPDLTNLRGRLGADGMTARLNDVLVTGPGQMPDFALAPTERDQLGAFLTSMDATGQGQARLVGAPPVSAWDQALSGVLAESGTPAARRGFTALQKRPCQACHVPLATSPSGAPDLSTVTQRLDHDALIDVLTHGRAPAMPAPSPAFTPEERADVAALFGWMLAYRDALDATDNDAFAWSALPWWEYE